MREQLQQALDREKTVRSTFQKNQEELQAKIEAADLAKSSMETNVTALSSKVKFCGKNSTDFTTLIHKEF